MFNFNDENVVINNKIWFHQYQNEMINFNQFFLSFSTKIFK